MSRPLPLATHPTPAASDPSQDVGDATPVTALRGTIAVFDPALCCPTGLCGPGVDPALLAISRDLRWLEKQGVSVSRAGLSTDPQAFVTNARVQGLMQAFGDAALPAVIVNDRVLAHGRYPTRDELVTALSEGGCCAPGSGCC